MNKDVGLMPFPDDESYIRAVQGVLPAEDAREVLRFLPSHEGWFAIDYTLTPVTLGLLVVYQPFAEWFMRRFPEHADTVREMRSMPEESALANIREGKWVHYLYFSDDA